MNKSLLGIVPPCITFGPLFMTRIGGTVDEKMSGGVVFVGVAMLAIGLIAMFRVIVAQQKVIEQLQPDGRSGV